MATHFWLFPWFALLAGLAALVLGCFGLSRTSTVPPVPRLPRPLLIVWVLVITGAMAAGFKLGASAGFDVIAARGLLLGALGGLALVILCRRPTTDAPTRLPLLLGLGTALVASGRLWLTHAEISGLTAVAFGVALTVLCLSLAPSLLSPIDADTDGAGSSATLGLLYVLTLAATVALGFLRAHTLGEMFWADIPLLLGGALSLGTAVGAGPARRHGSGLALWKTAAVPLAAALLVLLPLSFLTHVWRLAGLLLLGAILFAFLARLSSRPTPAADAETRTVGDSLGPLVGFVLIVAGVTLAFALSSGYGLGLFVLGGWFVASLFMGQDGVLPSVSALSFTTLLLVYRLGVLQNNPAVRASGPGDTWDLFAISLGALIPLLASEWAGRDGSSSRLAPWAVTLQWVLSLVVPAVILDYIWQPRSISGLLLGAALGQLLGSLGGDSARRFGPVALSGVVLSLTLFQFLPALGHVDTPTRTVRLGLIALGAVLLTIRALMPGQRFSRLVSE